MCKRILVLMFVLSSYVSGQEVPEFLHIKRDDSHIAFEKRNKNLKTHPIDIFSPYKGVLKISSSTSYAALQVSEKSLEFVLKKKPHLLSFNIFIENRNFNIEVNKVSIRSDEYHVHGSLTGSKNPAETVFYRGIVRNSLNGKVSLSVSERRLTMLIRDETGTYEVHPLFESVYSARKIDKSRDFKKFECLTETPSNYSTKIKSKGEKRTGSCVELYLECDYQLFVECGGTLADTEDWVNDLINEVGMIYEDIDVPLAIKEIFVHESTDPYASHSNAQSLMLDWQDDLQDNYDGRLAHFLCGRDIGGGIAWMDVLCSTYSTIGGTTFGPYGVSGNLDGSGITPFPAYSWNVEVVAHEFGHNFGSPHTHACVWGPDEDEQIDDCGTSIGYPDAQDDCYDPNNLIIPTLGTIMSYCHLVSGSGISFSTGFATEPGDLIYDKYINASCSTGDDCDGIPPPNDVCEDVIVLTGNTSCNPVTVSNVNATASGSTSGFSCGSTGTTKDVWFSFIVPTTGNISIETIQISGGLTDLIIQAYSGSCGSLTAIGCDDNSGSGNHAKLDLTGLVSGETIYARVVDSGSDDEGVFGICIHDPDFPCPPEIQPLLDLYEDTGGDNWTNNTGWEGGYNGNDCDFCNWFGVTCNNSGEITEIALNNNNLNGTLPSTLTDMTSLKRLELGINNISGTVPNTWDNTPDLEYIDFGNNNFSGPIPSTFGDAIDLWYLALQNNSFSGELPESIGYLDNLLLYYCVINDLSGCYPTSYENLCNIMIVDFQINSDLPFGGANFKNNCSGFDEDEDGYCNAGTGEDDCNDNDNSIYPTAPELCDGLDNDCDGLHDEGLPSVTNTWTGGTGSWGDDGKWSQGHFPLGCENVVIPDGSSNIISISGMGDMIYAKSIDIGNEAVLNISAGETLNIFSGGNLEINGMINNQGNIFIKNVTSGHEVKILATGGFNNSNGGNIEIE